MKGSIDVSPLIMFCIIFGLASAFAFLVVDSMIFYKISFEQKVYCMHEPNIEIAKQEFYLAVFSTVVVGALLLFYSYQVAHELMDRRKSV